MGEEEISKRKEDQKIKKIERTGGAAARRKREKNQEEAG